MKFLIFFIFNILASLAIANNTREEGLPFEPDTTVVNLNRIPGSNTINLDFTLSLPSTQKLNKGAPSFVSVYEKGKNDTRWIETQKFDLNSVMTFGDLVHFSKSVNLHAADSEIAVFSTVYHCGKDHKTACYIQGFKGVAKRSNAAMASSVIPFHIRGTMR